MDDAGSGPILPQAHLAELFAGPQPLSAGERRSMADAALSWLRSEFQGDLVAVALYGSTATKRDGPFSDLEMWAAIEDRAGARPGLEWVWGPGKLEINLLTVSELITRAARVDERWPITHGRFIHAVALWEAPAQAGFVERIKAAVADIPGAARSEAMAACVLELYELVGKLRNGRTGGPSDIARLACDFGVAMGCLVALQHRYVFLSGRRLFAEAHRLEGPAGFRAFLTRLAQGLLSPPEQVIDHAEQVWAAIPAWLDSIRLDVSGLTRAIADPAGLEVAARPNR